MDRKTLRRNKSCYSKAEKLQYYKETTVKKHANPTEKHPQRSLIMEGFFHQQYYSVQMAIIKKIKDADWLNGLIKAIQLSFVTKKSVKSK